MAILEVDSLFTLILLDETNRTFIENLYNNENPTNISKYDFRYLIKFNKNHFFMFRNKYYRQVDGGSSLWVTIFNLVVLEVYGFEIVLIISNLCSVDVILMTSVHCSLIKSDAADKCSDYSSSKHLYMNFSAEKEKDDCSPFLDCNIFRQKQKICN